jgi:glycosyltransferase involved in cell wall biosynthesis
MGREVFIYTQAYNAESTLRRAIDSVVAQDFCGFIPVYFLVDNGSTDGTRAIVDDYAARYDWIFPIHIGVNIPSVSMLLASALRPYFHNDSYFFSLDTDDEYSSEFFFKTFTFAKNNGLDIAACGIDIIDDSTGNKISERLVSADMVIAREQFAEKFTSWRRFFIERWGKIYHMRVLAEWFEPVINGNRRNSMIDFEDTLGIVGRANKIGVMCDCLFRYHRSRQSYTESFRAEQIPAVLEQHAGVIREFLLSYGSISKVNEDYIAAIYLGWCENQTNKLFSSSLPNKDKIKFVNDLLACPETHKMFERKNCDSQFRNLARRNDYKQKLKTQISALGGNCEELST